MPAAARTPRPAAPPPSSPAATVKNRKRKAATVDPPREDTERKESKRPRRATTPTPAAPAESAPEPVVAPEQQQPANAGPKPRRERAPRRPPPPPTRRSNRQRGRAPSPTPTMRLALAALEVEAHDIVMYEEENEAGPSGSSHDGDEDGDVTMVEAENENEEVGCVPPEPIEDLTVCPPEEALPCPAALHEKKSDSGKHEENAASDKGADSAGFEFVNESADTMNADETTEDSDDDDDADSDCSMIEQQIYLPDDEDAEGEDDVDSVIIQSWPVPPQHQQQSQLTTIFIPPCPTNALPTPPATPTPRRPIYPPPPGLRLKPHLHPCGRALADFTTDPQLDRGTPRVIPKQQMPAPRPITPQAHETWRWLACSAPVPPSVGPVDASDTEPPAPWVAWGAGGSVCAQEGYMAGEQVVGVEYAQEGYMQGYFAQPQEYAQPREGQYVQPQEGYPQQPQQEQYAQQGQENYAPQENYTQQQQQGYAATDNTGFASQSQPAYEAPTYGYEEPAYGSDATTGYNYGTEGAYTQGSTSYTPAPEVTTTYTPEPPYNSAEQYTAPSPEMYTSPSPEQYTSPSPEASTSYATSEGSTSYTMPEMYSSQSNFDAYSPPPTFAGTGEQSYDASTYNYQLFDIPASTSSDPSFTTPIDPALTAPTPMPAYTSPAPVSLPTPLPAPAQPLPGRLAGWTYRPRPRGGAPGTEGLMRVMARDLKVPSFPSGDCMSPSSAPVDGCISPSATTIAPTTPAPSVHVPQCISGWLRRLAYGGGRPRRLVASPARHAYPPLCASKLAYVVVGADE
ncbi:hypothetical protein EV714DRAFT_210976 [Schizophyllum commune]